MHVHTKLKQMYVKWHVLLERKGDLGANRVVDHNRSYILHSGTWGTYDPPPTRQRVFLRLYFG